jgi:hypothetical protein
LIPALVIPLTVGKHYEEAITCNKNFYTYGMLFWAYFVFFAARDFLTLITAIWFPYSEWISLVAQTLWSFVDVILVTILCIKTTISMSTGEFDVCKA